MSKNFNISVKKLTDDGLMRTACEMTFDGKSKQSLLSIYKSEHSPARTQLFWIEFNEIPLFVSTHLLRHHVGSIPFQLTCRDDRKGGNVAFPERMQDLQDKVAKLASKVEFEKDAVAYEQLFENIQDELENLKGNADRLTPVNLGLLVNAQSLIDMAKARLCLQSHADTIKVFKALKEAVKEVDPDLASMMVVKCVYRRGICGESRCCGYNKTKQFDKELANYKALF